MTVKVIDAFGGKLSSNNVRIGPYIHINNAEKNYSNLIVGNDVYIGPNVFLDLSEIICFNDHSAIGGNSQIFTHINLVGAFNQIFKPKKLAVIFEEHAGVNPGSIVHCGVTIKRYSYVSSGSVVLKDTESFNVYGGNPIKSVARIPENIIRAAEKKYLTLLEKNNERKDN